MTPDTDTDPDLSEAPESIRNLNDALQECFDDDSISGFDIALALCIALHYCGEFGDNVKLLADIDSDLAEDDEAVKYDA